MRQPRVTQRIGNSNHVGERVELGRYTVPGAGERIIYGQRVDGVVRLVDVPAAGQDRAYLIERELEVDGNDALNALVVDYLEQARIHQQIPMAESPLDRYVERLTEPEDDGTGRS